ncbi:MAG: class I SAM-dependent methyltransferase [Sedimentisphaerales bacterium]|nr:class I SAM-dependent methyltransferase [Sedimentisphaerales bacterium]
MANYESTSVYIPLTETDCPDPREVNLFEVELKERDYPEKIEQQQREAMFQYGREYYDDAAYPGFRGYRYNGSWRSIAASIFRYFKLPPDARILDVGCAKGFLLYDFKEVQPACRVSGVDISSYAIEHALPEVKENLICTSCTELPFEDGAFDLVVCLDTLHNLTDDDCRKAVREIRRVGRKHQFIMVHSYYTEQQRKNLLRWEVTIQQVLSVQEWKNLYREEGYQGLYYWKIFI